MSSRSVVINNERIHHGTTRVRLAALALAWAAAFLASPPLRADAQTQEPYVVGLALSGVISGTPAIGPTLTVARGLTPKPSGTLGFVAGAMFNRSDHFNLYTLLGGARLTKTTDTKSRYGQLFVTMQQRRDDFGDEDHGYPRTGPGVFAGAGIIRPISPTLNYMAEVDLGLMTDRQRRETVSWRTFPELFLVFGLSKRFAKE